MNDSTVAVARRHYKQASKSLLLRDYSSTATLLDLGFKSLPSSSSHGDEWLQFILQGEPIPPHVDLRRRLEILKITLLATTTSSTSPLYSSSSFVHLVELPRDKLVKSLWNDLVVVSNDNDSDEEFVMTPTRIVHPSIITALCLAALKLQQPLFAKQVAETWLNSIQTRDDDDEQEIEKLCFKELQQSDFNWELEIPLDGMSTSTSMGGSNIISSSESSSSSSNEGRKQLTKCLIKLIDLLVLHVYPRLQEWEQAQDFIRLQSQENGGWLPDQRVDATLERLTQLRQEVIDSDTAKLQRQEEIKAHKATLNDNKRVNGKGKGKGKARDHSPTSTTSSSNGSSPEKKKQRSINKKKNGNATTLDSTSASSSSSSSVVHSTATSPTSTLPPSIPLPHEHDTSTGFAGLRSSITSYLSRRSTSSPSTTTTTTTTRSSSITAIAQYFSQHYSKDPLRLLSLICFCLALSTYLRRRWVSSPFARTTKTTTAKDNRGGTMLKLVFNKIGQTLKMGTKVTTL